MDFSVIVTTYDRQGKRLGGFQRAFEFGETPNDQIDEALTALLRLVVAESQSGTVRVVIDAAV